MSECPLTPGELIQKLIEGQMDEHWKRNKIR
jgi:hypothetical protein